MTHITTPVAVDNNGPVVINKLLAIHDHWFGASARNSEATIAGSVGRLSSLLSSTSFAELSCGEERATYLPKLNALNEPTAFIADTSFGNGEDGSFWGDLSDVFTNTAGTTPATWGNSVARIDDQSPNGRNAVQASAALRPLLGRAPAAGRRNLLRHTENLADAYWSTINDLTVASEGNGVFRLNDAVDATPRRYAIRASSGNGMMPEGPRTVSVDVKAGTISSVILSQQASGTQGIGVNSAVFNMTSGEFSFIGAAFVETSVTALPDGWFRISASRDDLAAVSSRGFSIGMGEDDYAGDGTGTVFVRFPHAGVGLDDTPYQRVGATGLDVTEQGFPSFGFIRFDLSDDVLPTTFPDGGTFDVMLFGRGGSWIERDVEIAAAGSLNIGPTTITGGPAGLLAALGDIVGVKAVDRTITATELNRLVQYHKARGAGDLLESI